MITFFGSSVSVPKSYQEELMHAEYKQIMDDEMDALISRQTWGLVPTSLGLHVVSCCWIFAIKYHPDGMMDRYKAHLVARCYTQTYVVDYLEPSHVTRLNSIRIIFI